VLCGEKITAPNVSPKAGPGFRAEVLDAFDATVESAAGALRDSTTLNFVSSERNSV
jgi:hypothetical protein